jgi:predicted transcriptional regulator
MTTSNGLLPSRESVETDASAESVSLDEAGAVIDALGSRTARSILAALYEEPRPASEIAAAVETSTQNVNYHLDRLREAALVEVVDTWYSSKGAEMDVYAPTADPLCVFIGAPDNGTVSAAVDESAESVTSARAGD